MATVKITLTQELLIEAVQYWLNKTVLKSTCSVMGVLVVKTANHLDTFEVLASYPEGPGMAKPEHMLGRAIPTRAGEQ